MTNAAGFKMVMLMLDGFGWPPEGWKNSIYSKCCPAEFVRLFADNAYPIDARLGVEGIPQSATGQTALFCGENAPALIGRHLHAFPGPRLKELIRRKNIFQAVKALGLKPVFANAYVRQPLLEVAQTRYSSVTTVMTAAALGWSFVADDLRRGCGVFHDITNSSCPEEAAIPAITPEDAAANLLRLTADYDFVLFEYFLTDRAGHRCDFEQVSQALEPVSRLVAALAAALPANHQLLVTADHGNCEDLSVGSHSMNPVPLLLCGNGTEHAARIGNIAQVYDLALNRLETPLIGVNAL